MYLTMVQFKLERLCLFGLALKSLYSFLKNKNKWREQVFRDSSFKLLTVSSSSFPSHPFSFSAMISCFSNLKMSHFLKIVNLIRNSIFLC
jgi:hypothetical protein